MQIDLVTRSSSTMRELLLFVGISILRPSLGVEPDPYSVDVISAFNQTICPLEPIENGHYLDISGTKGGIAVQVVCSLGYKRVGNGFHMCNVTTGNFSNGRSYCQGCPVERLENGHYLDVSDDKVGVAIQVVCSSGYKLEGIGYHVCDVTTGNFTNGRSYCQDIDECQGNVTRHQCNINAACINLPGKHLCKCKLGYAGNGINCRRVEDCSPLPNPENGRVILTNRVARYECYPGFHRYGPGIRLCRRGKWSRVAPKCVEARPNSCRTPRAPLHGTVAGANFEKGQMIRYFCDKGYVLEGPETRNCSESLRWTGIRPVCVQEASRSVTEIAETLKDKISDISAGSSTGRLHTGGASGADIVFMIDRSSSIKPSNLNRVKDFMMMVIAELGVDNANPEGNGTRIAVLTFGNKPEMLFNLDNKTINSEVKVRQMLDSIKPYGGETALRDAIEKVYTESAQIARPKAQKALFIFADGQSNSKTTSDTKFFLRMLKDKNSGFEVFVIGVGARIMVKDLLQYASKPSRKYFFNLENFEDLTRPDPSSCIGQKQPIMWYSRAGRIHRNGDKHRSKAGLLAVDGSSL
ncbi:complement factor B-like [Liolophura sinensis]|uniref:complement factor B-like n=1 Tax=Liolophura sinensis TaxID=3198878 RepID=UPI0031584FF0